MSDILKMKKIYATLVVVTTLVFIYLCTTGDDYEKYRIKGESIIHKSNLTSKSAVMFDIDKTLVQGINPIQPIIDLCNYAKQLGIAVILITARPNTHVSKIITTRQLAKHDILYDALIFSPAVHKKIVKKDLDLDFIFSIGDLPTDVDGEHGGVPILLKK